ncbi:MAG TPA: hypothetical protein VMW16_04830 [Sedimentisphaerales bacterium]|nr:hypothetical protein [Sedimentisphaerales bacterium]
MSHTISRQWSESRQEALGPCKKAGDEAADTEQEASNCGLGGTDAVKRQPNMSFCPDGVRSPGPSRKTIMAIVGVSSDNPNCSSLLDLQAASTVRVEQFAKGSHTVAGTISKTTNFFEK